MSATDRSTALQEDLQAYLAARPFFHGSGTQKDIPVIVENIGDIDAAVAKAVGSIGVCVLIMTPAGLNTQRNAPVAILKPTVVARVSENVGVNRGSTGSRQAASKVADAVAVYLHQNEACGHFLIFTEKVLQLDQKDLTYDVIFEGTEMSLTEPTR